MNTSFEDYMAEARQVKDRNIQSIKQMLGELQAAGFSDKIEFEFYGSGDSGEITTPTLPPELHGAIDALGYRVEYHNTNTKHNILGAIGSVLPGGWEINEGSSGKIVLDIARGKIVVDIGWNVTTQEYEQQEY